MAKKILFLILSLLPLCTWSYQQPCCWSAWGSGLYLGTGIGVDATEFRITSYPSQAGNFNVINKTQVSAQGILGDLFAGYSLRYCWLSLAGEINGSLSSARFHTSNQDFVHDSFAGTTYKMNRSWGISVLPGIILPETTMLYGRVGYVSGYFNSETTDNSLANVSTRLNGLRYGLGIQKRLCKNLDMRFEYSRISYQDHSDTVFEPIGAVTKQTIITPFSNQFMLGAVYRFY